MLIADGTESVAGQLKNLAIARPDPIAPRIHGAYGNFFQALCRFASENRDDGKVSDEEFAVSAHLAAPFSPGGLLILLKEPLRKHPWKSGVAKVVAECPTLASIKDGLKQAGNLSLQEEVSIIDRWPFLPQPTKAKPNKARGTKRLDQLLLNAICAKQPDVILCMGRDAEEFLAPLRGRLVRSPGHSIKIIHTFHPSHAVNYSYKDCDHRRRILYDSIEKACCLLREATTAPTLSPVVAHDTDAFARDRNEERDTQALQEFLCELWRLCIGPGEPPPSCCLQQDASAFLCVKQVQRTKLEHQIKCVDAEDDDTVRARRVLVPLFMRLNRMLTPSAYFGNRYKVDWDGVSRTLGQLPDNFEDLCWVAAGTRREEKIASFISMMDLFDELPMGNFDNLHVVRLERITINLRSTTWVGAPLLGLWNGRCRTCGNLRFSDQELTKDFRAAYIPIHHCGSAPCTRYRNSVVVASWTPRRSMSPP